MSLYYVQGELCSLHVRCIVPFDGMYRGADGQSPAHDWVGIAHEHTTEPVPDCFFTRRQKARRGRKAAKSMMVPMERMKLRKVGREKRVV